MLVAQAPPVSDALALGVWLVCFLGVIGGLLGVYWLARQIWLSHQPAGDSAAATKAELDELHRCVEKRLDSLRSEVRAEWATFREEVKKELLDQRNERREQIREMEHGMRESFRHMAGGLQSVIVGMARLEAMRGLPPAVPLPSHADPGQGAPG